MKVPVGGLGGRGEPQRARTAQSGKARGSTTGPRCCFPPCVNKSSAGPGSGVPPRLSHGFTDPSDGASRRALVTVRGRPRQSVAHLGRPAGLGRYGVHPRRGSRNKPRSVSRGPRGPGVHSLLPQFDVFRRGPRLRVMAAAPSPRFWLLRVCRTRRSEAPLTCPPVLGEVSTPV
ncbi:hypothetical protein NDU88_004627 [Pleurodeles waltl]|uniref:Uncharacterized protein n=1 Tax=Pleurodeles waltl TaxID=8319 RepID=A0AAV7RLW1_PLEWA|nr:hypothetical protein NDU88_004627 [Pleurodeles waltl]